MKPYLPVRLLAAVALAAHGLLAGCGSSVPDTVKIGVALPLSGSSAARGQDLLNGVKLAVNELNAGGYKVAGKPVKLEVVALDDKGDKATAVKVAQDLVDQKVIAVFGHLSSDITEATIPVYKAGNVPQLFTSSADSLTALSDGNGFRLVASDALQARAIASYLSDPMKANSVAIIYENTAFGTPINKDVSAALTTAKKSISLSEPVDNKMVDFSAFVAKLKAAPPDAIVAVLRDHQLLPLFKQLNAAQLSQIPVIVTSAAKTSMLAGGPADMNTVYLTSSSLDPSEFGGGTAFLNKFRAAYNAEPVWAAHYAYDGVYALSHALRQAESIDANKLREQMRTMDPSVPVTVSMRFTPGGEQRYGAVAVYQRRNGQWQPLMRSDKW
jgi:branched-chain amino acid transport system substrate-binding protein